MCSDAILDTPSILAEKALSIMHNSHIPCTPDNYSIWYTYAEGYNTELCDYLDELISNKLKFDYQTCADIYQKFFGSGLTAAITEASDNLDNIINSVNQELGETSKSMKNMGSWLVSTQKTLSKMDNSSSLASLVKQLLGHVVNAMQSTSKSQKHIKKSATKIYDLKQQLTQLTTQANTDELTGLANRRSFHQELSKTFAETSVRGSDLSLIILDLDNFATFNKTYGKVVGNLVLRYIGAMVKKSSHKSGYSARLSGDKFIILLLEHGPQRVAVFAKQIGKAISEQELKVGKSIQRSVGAVTASIGATSIADGDSEQTFLERANSHLKEAKAKGKNTVICR